MSSRFITIKKDNEAKYYDNGPVAIMASALLKDSETEKILVQIKMKNLSNKVIIGCSVDVAAYLIGGENTAGVEGFAYLDLRVSQGEEFGSKTPVYLEDNRTRDYSLFVREIVFDDNSKWINTDESSIPFPQLREISDYYNNDVIVQQYHIAMGDNSDYYPYESNGLVMCTCGAIWYKRDSSECYICKRSYSELSLVNDDDFFQKLVDGIYDSTDAFIQSEELDQCNEAINRLNKISEWKNVDEKVIRCEQVISSIRARKEEEREKQIVRDKESARKRTIVTLIVASITVALLVFVLVWIKIIKPNQKHQEAMDLISAGKYEDAYALLDELGKGDEINANKYDRAMELYNSGEYEGAYDLFSELDYQDSRDKLNEITEIMLSKAQVGSYVNFGHYEQDNDFSNGKEPIEWLVLAKNDTEMLLITRYVVDWEDYASINSYYMLNRWEGGYVHLKYWLKDTFIESAFNEYEKNKIQTRSVGKVFILNDLEANTYFSSNSDRTCSPTKYAIEHYAQVNSEGNCWWWLRSPVTEDSEYDDEVNVAVVEYDGSIYTKGRTAAAVSANGQRDLFYGGGVRPAIWIGLSDSPSEPKELEY